MTKHSTQGQKLKSVEQRFFEKFEKGDGCWIWNSAIGSRGYGIFWHGSKRRSLMAHRFALELSTGQELPPDKVVMHACDTPACVNPAHLSLGTIRENALDAKSKGRLAVGERNGGGRKLSTEQVIGIRRRKGTTSGPDEARLNGVSRYLVNAIRSNKVWKHLDG